MAEEKKEKEKAGKTKKLTALKRDEQGAKRNLRNRSFKSKVVTALRALEDSLSKKDIAAAKAQLNDIYGLMDKGVKKGIYKMNKANRVKSRLHARTKTLSV